MPSSVVIAGVRTPIGRLSGALSQFTAAELGGLVIAEAVQRAGIEPDMVDQVIMGQVLQAGQGQNPARQAALHGGIPFRVPAMTINKACLAGLQSLHIADLIIRTGEADVVLVGGMDSMTSAPYLLPKARSGYRFADAKVFDAIQLDGLLCALDHTAMGAATDHYAACAGITRERQDGYALLSHERAASATASGYLVDEIVPITTGSDTSCPNTMTTDEGVRPATTLADLEKLPPAFSPNGTITAGNASQLSDGAAALVVASRARADSLGLTPIAELLGYGQVAGPDPSLLTQPSRAIRAALERASVRLSDVDLFEINEAFAAVTIATMDDLGLTPELVNVNGGAIAYGHPFAMSGPRLVLTLIHELRRRRACTGAAALCGGGGQGDAALLRVIA